MDLTVKFISTVCQMGSSSSTAKRVDKLSAAAGKFNVMIGTSIKKCLKQTEKTDSPEKENEVPKTKKQSNTIVVTKTISDCTPEDASLIAKCLFDGMEQEGNSEGYVAAKARFDTCKSNVLANLGVTEYEKLSLEQRQVYANEMIAAKAPFKYTQRSIHIKYGSYQTIYSKTVRKIGTAHYKNDVYDNKVDLDQLRKKYTVSMRDVKNMESKLTEDPDKE